MEGCAMTKVVIRRRLTPETRDGFRVYVGHSDCGIGFSLSTSVFSSPLSFHQCSVLIFMSLLLEW